MMQFGLYNLPGLGWGRLLWLLLLLSTLSTAADSEGASAPRIGSHLPSLTLTDLGGVSYRIPESLRGKVLVLHFWIAGCSSCKEEMPAMDRLYRDYRQKGLEILAVNVGQKKTIVQGFAGVLGVSYPLLVDVEGKSADVYGATNVPRTYVIDRKGVIRYRVLGGVAPQMLKKLVLSLL